MICKKLVSNHIIFNSKLYDIKHEIMRALPKEWFKDNVIIGTNLIISNEAINHLNTKDENN